MPTRFYYDGVLPNVERPSRYIDGELNLSSPGYREGFFNVLLVFPDTYEIGMSHQGLRFLYHRLASLEGVGVEFAFAPWPDAERFIRRCGERLRSWQTATEADRFDLIGFSLTYELHYTNLLMILDLAGLALEAADRSEDDPLVIAGGPCCTNPLPFLNALDAICLGDGEEALPEAVRALRAGRASGAGREELKRALSGVSGFFVRGVSRAAEHGAYRFRPGDLPRSPLTPSAGIVHDRLAVEIMRGCARGCRFCHAGVFYRPRRERTVDEIVDAACRGLDSSGWGELSLLSLSTSDYSRLDELLGRLIPELERRRVSLALPSLRPETITERIVASNAVGRRSGFTLAPEAGTERLRGVIGKGVTDADILDGCRRILDGGWQNLKLYFMIGLPTETEEDLEGIASLTGRILALPRRSRRFRLGISISPFVPKVFTPFQWERQCSPEELLQKGRYLRTRIGGKNARLSLRDPAISTLEGIFARGDERLWHVLVEAYRTGCRFDGWRDRLDFERWKRALAKCGLTVSELLSDIPIGDPLPWSAFAPPVSERFLRRERERAFAESADADCGRGRLPSGESIGLRAGRPESAGGGSQGGGAAHGEAPVPAASGASKGAFAPPVTRVSISAPAPDQSPVIRGAARRYRFVYEKTGRQRFLSHIEMINLFHRALRSSGMPLSFTEGFHPHPRLSLGPSLAVGMEGLREFFDIELTEATKVEPERIDAFLPSGIRIVEYAGPFTRKAAKLPPRMRLRYELHLGSLLCVCEIGGGGGERLCGEKRLWYNLGVELGLRGGKSERSSAFLDDPVGYCTERLEEMFASGAVIRERRGRERSCEGYTLEKGGNGETLRFMIHAGNEGFAGPKDLLASILPERAVALVGIRRLEILYETEAGFLSPLSLVS